MVGTAQVRLCLPYASAFNAIGLTIPPDQFVAPNAS